MIWDWDIRTIQTLDIHFQGQNFHIHIMLACIFVNVLTGKLLPNACLNYDYRLPIRNQRACICSKHKEPNVKFTLPFLLLPIIEQLHTFPQ